MHSPVANSPASMDDSHLATPRDDDTHAESGLRMKMKDEEYVDKTWEYPEEYYGCSWEDGLDLINNHDWVCQDGDLINLPTKTPSEPDLEARMEDEMPDIVQDGPQTNSFDTQSIEQGPPGPLLVSPLQIGSDSLRMKPDEGDTALAVKPMQQETENVSDDVPENSHQSEPEINVATEVAQSGPGPVPTSSPPWIPSPPKVSGAQTLDPVDQSTTISSPKDPQPVIKSCKEDGQLDFAAMEVDVEARACVEVTEALPKEQPTAQANLAGEEEASHNPAALPSLTGVATPTAQVEPPGIPVNFGPVIPQEHTLLPSTEAESLSTLAEPSEPLTNFGPVIWQENAFTPREDDQDVQHAPENTTFGLNSNISHGVSVLSPPASENQLELLAQDHIPTGQPTPPIGHSTFQSPSPSVPTSLLDMPFRPADHGTPLHVTIEAPTDQMRQSCAPIPFDITDSLAAGVAAFPSNGNVSEPSATTFEVPHPTHVEHEEPPELPRHNDSAGDVGRGPENLLMGLAEAAAAASPAYVPTQVDNSYETIAPSQCTLAPIQTTGATSPRWSSPVLTHASAYNVDLPPSPYTGHPTPVDRPLWDYTISSEPLHQTPAPDELDMVSDISDAPSPLLQQEESVEVDMMEDVKLDAQPDSQDATETLVPHTPASVHKEPAQLSQEPLAPKPKGKQQQGKPSSKKKPTATKKGGAAYKPSDSSESEFDAPPKKKHKRVASSGGDMSQPNTRGGPKQNKDDKEKKEEEHGEPAKQMVSVSLVIIMVKIYLCTCRASCCIFHPKDWLLPSLLCINTPAQAEMLTSHQVESLNDKPPSTTPPTQHPLTSTSDPTSATNPPIDPALPDAEHDIVPSSTNPADETAQSTPVQNSSPESNNQLGRNTKKHVPRDFVDYGKRTTRSETKSDKSKSQDTSTNSSPVPGAYRSHNNARDDQEMLVDAESTDTAQPKQTIASKTKDRATIRKKAAPTNSSTTPSKVTKSKTTPRTRITTKPISLPTGKNMFGFKEPNATTRAKTRARKSDGDAVEAVPAAPSTQLEVRKTRHASAAEAEEEKEHNIGKRLRSGDIKK